MRRAVVVLALVVGLAGCGSSGPGEDGPPVPFVTEPTAAPWEVQS